MKVFFQIGTNDGNDDFLKWTKNENPDLIILVEPNPNLVPLIKENYKNFNIKIYSNAIYYEDGKDIELYIPKNRGYHHTHFSLMPMNDWGDSKDGMTKLISKSITFETICKENNLTEIELLQMDTEGFDSEIIKMIDFSKIRIKKIIFEKWGFKTECFTKFHNDKANDLGINGMNNSIKKLESHGYKMIDVDDPENYTFIL